MISTKWLVIACGCCVVGVVAAAETAAPDKQTKQDDNVALDEIVVTGTRLAISGDSAPTPVTMIAQEQMLLAAPTSLADALAQIPEFRGSSRPGTFVTPQGSTGAFLNLRGLGQNRVLTLFDGRRVVPATQAERVDVNTLPDLLVKRVDIVTGGASAAYGSDAIAGVVNFVLDDEYEGIKGDLGGGVSSRSDNQSYKARMAFGTKLLGGRGHLITSVDYFKSKGVLNVDNRSWDAQHCNVIANPTFATDSRTAFLWRCGVTGTQFATGGVITAGPLRGTQFIQGGVPATFNYGSEVSAGTMVGGDGYWNPRGNVATPLTNKNAFMHFAYDVNDDVRLFGEGSYSQSDSYFYGTSPSYSGTTGITIYNDNAFLPAATKAQMTTLNLASFALGRISPDWGRNEAVSNVDTYRGAVGLKGTFGAWQIDTVVDSGHTHLRLENNHSPNQIRLFEALDSVIGPNGQPICRSMLVAANASRGCVPLNPFGYGSASPEAIAYVFGEGGYSDTYINQTAAELNVRGMPFRTWAGEAALATGVAWRRTDMEQLSDPLSQTVITQVTGSKGMPASLVNKLGVFLTGSQNYQPKKAVAVKEAYAELQVPLARDYRFLHAADANAAYRYADYSTTGSVNAWKVGGSIEPIQSIRFRATRSRDVRAPNIPELYAPLLGSLGPINDPVKGTNNNVVGYSGGNSNLVPEIANTFTAGVVLRPDFLPNFSLSVDYYKIEIANSIGNLGGQNLVNLCYNGSTEYCQYVSRLADGTLAAVYGLTLNLNKLVNSGVDYEANYNTTVGGVKLGVRALASYLRTLATTDPFGTVTEQAGVNGGEGTGTPYWQGSLGLTVGYRDLTAFIQERFIGGGLYSNQYVVGGRATNSIDYNHVDGRTYTDLTLRYDIHTANAEWQLYGTINNLMDRDPPPSPTRIGAPASILGTNPTLYDVIGRQYNAGVRFSF